MKVLVLGARGMLGKDLVPILSAKGQVWADPLSGGGSSPSPECLWKLQASGGTLHPGDTGESFDLPAMICRSAHNEKAIELLSIMSRLNDKKPLAYIVGKMLHLNGEIETVSNDLAVHLSYVEIDEDTLVEIRFENINNDFISDVKRIP